MRVYCRRPPSSLFTKRYFHVPTAAESRARAIKRFGAPKSIEAIADGIEDVGDRAVAIRRIGSCRRVVLYDPYLNPREFEGLAYRLRMLKANRGLSSVLIVPDDLEAFRKETDEIPVEEDDDFLHILGTFPPAPGHTWHVAGGCDPMEFTNRNVGPILRNLSDLARAVRGEDAHKSKIPFIFAPNGAVTDGGSAFMLSSYVLVADNSSFSILNPGRGLTLDPTGMSWLLPRLGHEFRQPSAQWSLGCAIILALMGYEADYKDMIQTGLATHYVSSPDFIHELENMLGQTLPWEQQAVLKEPQRYQGDMAKSAHPEIYEPNYDHNAQFRNIEVAERISDVSAMSAEGKDLLITPLDETSYNLADPSLDVESYPAMTDYEMVDSNLVNYAATFHDLFNREGGDLVGILDRLKDIANSSSTDVDQEVKEVAADFVKRLERQSPLALACTYRLLWLGSRQNETVDSCMRRELAAQMKLLESPDFETWRNAQRKSKETTCRPVEGVKWQYKHIKDVPADLVADIVRQHLE